MPRLKKFFDFGALAWIYDHILMEYFEVCFWNTLGLYIDNVKSGDCVYEFDRVPAGAVRGAEQS